MLMLAALAFPFGRLCAETNAERRARLLDGIVKKESGDVCIPTRLADRIPEIDGIGIQSTDHFVTLIRKLYPEFDPLEFFKFCGNEDTGYDKSVEKCSKIS